MTYDEMLTAVRYRLDVDSDDSDANTQIGQAINDAYQDVVARYDLDINDASIDSVAEAFEITLPTSWLKIRAIRYGSVPLARITLEEWWERRTLGNDASTGTPYVYAPKPPTEFVVWPAPDSSATGAFDALYVPLPSDLTGANEPALIPDPYHYGLLVLPALARLLRTERLDVEADKAQLEADRAEGRFRSMLFPRDGVESPEINRKFYG